MSLEELWQLFPITLEPFNPEWIDLANEEIVFLNKLLYFVDPIISHIGSTAIAGIYSKPIIDILVETQDTTAWNKVNELMEYNGYIMMSRTDTRMSFNKGYTVNGYENKVYHIHFHISGDNDEIRFRDYLRNNPSVAKEYEQLKLSLLAEFRNNRDGYTSAKTDFIRKVLLKA